MQAYEGHDGPYDAPVVLSPRTVLPEWIDYNGHMNVAYYTMAFDKTFDELFDQVLGIGEAHAKRTRHGPYALHSNVHYLGELFEGEQFVPRVRLLDFDEKRMHMFIELHNITRDVPAAAGEHLLMNVDLEKRRAVPYLDWVQARLETMLETHKTLAKPTQIGTTVGIRRKG